MKIHHYTSLVAVTAIAVTSLSARTLIDFDTPGDYENNFTGAFLELPGGGVAGSGGVETTALTQIAVFQEGIDLRTFDNGYVSIMFQYNGADMTGAPLTIGFTSGPNDFADDFSRSSGTADFRFLLLGSGNLEHGYSVNIRDNGIGFGRSPDFALTPNAWYKAKLTIGSVEDGWIMNARAELFAVDDEGNVGERIAVYDTVALVRPEGDPRYVDSVGGPINRENDLALAEVVYPFFGGQEPWPRGVGAVDNFSFSATGEAPAPPRTLIDFDTPGDYENNFTGAFLELPGGGVAGSGGVETTALNQVAVFQEGIDLKTFDNGYVSVMFQYNGADSTGAPLALGFTSSPDDVFDTFGKTTGTADFRFLLLGSNEPDGYAVNIRDDGVGFGRSVFVPLTPNAWYKAKLTIGSVEDGWIMNAVAELFEVDAEGNVGARIAVYDTVQQVRPVDDPRYIDSVGGPINRENALALADLVYPFFGGQEPWPRGVGAVDNFSFSAIGEAPAPTWFGWNVGADGWVDTGDWIGWVYVAEDPWVWIHGSQSWAYMPDESGWAFVPR